jgi:hypothetical protein
VPAQSSRRKACPHRLRGQPCDAMGFSAKSQRSAEHPAWAPACIAPNLVFARVSIKIQRWLPPVKGQGQHFQYSLGFLTLQADTAGGSRSEPSPPVGACQGPQSTTCSGSRQRAPSPAAKRSGTADRHTPQPPWQSVDPGTSRDRLRRTPASVRSGRGTGALQESGSSQPHLPSGLIAADHGSQTPRHGWRELSSSATAAASDGAGGPRLPPRQSSASGAVPPGCIGPVASAGQQQLLRSPGGTQQQAPPCNRQPVGERRDRSVPMGSGCSAAGMAHRPGCSAAAHGAGKRPGRAAEARLASLAGPSQGIPAKG